MDIQDKKGVQGQPEEVLEINLETDPMDVITRFCIDRLENLLGTMEMERRLCDDISGGVVAEFKFRGTKKSVQEQLLALINYRRVVPYGEQDRDQLIKEHMAFNKYNEELLEHPLRKEMSRVGKQYGLHPNDEHMERLGQVFKSYDKLKFMLHKKGECICHSNMPQ